MELPGPAGALEAVVNEGSADAPVAALLCHPHPLGGGTLHNKVVYHAMKAMNAPEWGLGWPVLRFNFRGTGLSQGVHDGAAEIADVQAALDWLRNEFRLPAIVAGFSFGAAMALAACCGHKPAAAVSGPAASRPAASGPAAEIRALVAIGLPVLSGASAANLKIYDYSFLADCTLPKLFLSGDQDQYASPSELMQVVAAAAPPNHLALVPGADHFFTGRLEPMQSSLSDWLKEHVL